MPARGLAVFACVGADMISIPFSYDAYVKKPEVQWHDEHTGWVTVDEVVGMHEYDGVHLASIRLSDGSIPIVQIGELRMVLPVPAKPVALTLADVYPLTLLIVGMTIGYVIGFFVS